VNRILLVEDKRGMRMMLSTALGEDGWEVTAVSNGEKAITELRSAGIPFDMILSDICLPGSADGITVLDTARELTPFTPVILMTAFGTIDMAVSAMKSGARDFITKPFELEDLLRLTRRHATSHEREMIGTSAVLGREVERAMKGATTDLNMLILGESGTGKELLARMIHTESRWKEGPFVPVNCAAIPGELMESELFGAEKGAYTGADATRKGRFELARGGTILLDEIGDLVPFLQGKLLRILQEKEYNRVGGSEILRSEVRVISASNRDLAGAIESGQFRKDLYYRLSEFPVTLPPLRNRSEDIPDLARYFLRQSGYDNLEITGDAMSTLRAYGWPGNVRELRSIVLRAAVLTTCDSIDTDLLEIGTESPETEGLLAEAAKVARAREREMILSALQETNGNRRKAALILKVSYRTLLSRIKELEL
jgi:two-component system response regulator AtoC